MFFQVPVAVNFASKLWTRAERYYRSVVLISDQFRLALRATRLVQWTLQFQGLLSMLCLCSSMQSNKGCYGNPKGPRFYSRPSTTAEPN